jgi:peptidoglycan/LPS O-acetylase OafA/YrhL
MSSTVKYRPEIDGLRALSVLAVIAYHINPSTIKGGFLGVDVFFVISGFLITSIIRNDIINNSFSFSTFWIRRFRRLYPQLLLLVGFVLIVGNFVLIRPERNNLIYQSIASIFSFSNIYLLRTTGGYWDSASENIPLLHTWSLSLEEQFYLLLPVILFFINKYFRKFPFKILIALLIFSLIACYFVTIFRKNAAFYLLPTRMWELLLGSLLPFYSVDSKLSGKYIFNGFLPCIGIVLIIASFFTIENSKSFPGIYPIFPCIGALLILSSSSEGLSNYILSSKPLTYIGKTSYSLYLWHWPVIVYSKYLTTKPSGIFIITTTVLLSIAAYYFVEKPQRKRVSFSYLLFIGFIITVSLSVILFIPNNSIIPRYISFLDDKEVVKKGLEYEATDRILSGKGGILIGNRERESKPSLVIIGSSHARVLATGFDDCLKENDKTALVLATSGIGLTDNSCNLNKIINKYRVDEIIRLQPDVVIVAGQWVEEMKNNDFYEQLTIQLDQISRVCKKVIVLSQVPTCMLPDGYHNSPRKHALAQHHDNINISINPMNDVTQTNINLEKKIVSSKCLGNVIFINMDKWMLNPDGTIHIIDNNKFLYCDSHHLNDHGSKYLVKQLLQYLTINIQ